MRVCQVSKEDKQRPGWGMKTKMCEGQGRPVWKVESVRGRSGQEGSPDGREEGFGEQRLVTSEGPCVGHSPV